MVAHLRLETSIVHDFGTRYITFSFDGMPKEDGSNVNAMEITFKPNVFFKVKRHPWAMPCTSLCGLELTRFRNTCFKCRTRRVFYGKMPTKQDVWCYTLLVTKHKRFGAMKDLLIKKILSFVEAHLAT